MESHKLISSGASAYSPHEPQKQPVLEGSEREINRVRNHRKMRAMWVALQVPNARKFENSQCPDPGFVKHVCIWLNVVMIKRIVGTLA